MTEQNVTEDIPSERSSPQCELCEIYPVSHRCQNCSEWMCDGCKRSHEKSKASRHHRMEPLAYIQFKTIDKLKHEVEHMTKHVTDLQSAVAVCKAGLVSADDVQVTSLTACVANRAECHDDVDKHFDSMETRIRNVTEKAKQDNKDDIDMFEANIREIQQHSDEISQSIAANGPKLAVEGETLIKEAQSYIESIRSPAVNIQIPEIKLERNEQWKASDAVTLKVSGAAQVTTAATVSGIHYKHRLYQTMNKHVIYSSCQFSFLHDKRSRH